MYKKQIKNVIQAIEDNLNINYSTKSLTDMINMSNSQFTDVFRFYSGYSMKQYMRKRILSESTLDLKRGMKVIDVALKYGYSTPDAFTFAFKSEFSFSPSEYINNPRDLNFHSKLSDEIIERKSEFINDYNFSSSKEVVSQFKGSIEELSSVGLFDAASLDDVTHTCEVAINIENSLIYFESLKDILLPIEVYRGLDFSNNGSEDALLASLIIMYLARMEEHSEEVQRTGTIKVSEDEMERLSYLIQTHYDLKNPRLIGNYYHFGLNQKMKEIIKNLKIALKNKENH